MAKKSKAQKPKPQTEDPEQSRRFMDAVRDLEVAGELNPTEGDKLFEMAMRRVLKKERRD